MASSRAQVARRDTAMWVVAGLWVMAAALWIFAADNIALGAMSLVIGVLFLTLVRPRVTDEPIARLLATDAEIATASGDDPLVLQLVAHRVEDTPAFGHEGAVVFLHDFWGDVACQVAGPAAAAAQLLEATAGELAAADYVGVPDDVVPLLPEGFFTAQGRARFRWTDRRPDPPSHEAAWLTEAEWPEVTRLLADGFEAASTRPGDERARRWAGIRAADGRLVACAADCSRPGIGVLAAVVTDPGDRRTGLGLAISSWLTHRLLDIHGQVALWQDSPNDAADALYDRLGYRPGQAVTFGVLSPAE